MILLTGAAGFIGRHVTDVLAKSGARVRAFDRAAFADAPAGVETVQGSIADLPPPALGKLLDGVTAIIHLAAISSLWIPRPTDYLQVNAFAAGRLAAAARRAGIGRFLYVSSLTTFVSGPAGGIPLLVDERLRPHPDALLGPYPRAKRLGEILTLAENCDEFRVSVLAPTLPLGPGDMNMTAPTRLVADLAAGVIPAILETPMNFIDVRDLATTIVAALERARPGETYLLAGEDVALSTFAAEIAAASGRHRVASHVSPPLALAAAWFDEAVLAPICRRAPRASLTGARLALRPRLFDASKARAELGLAVRPRVESLRDTLAALRVEHGQGRGN